VLGARETPLLRKGSLRLMRLDSHVGLHPAAVSTWTRTRDMKLNGEESLALRLASSVRISTTSRSYLSANGQLLPRARRASEQLRVVELEA